MIPLLLNHLKYTYGWKIPIVFTYFSTRMMLAALTSLIICIIIGPWFIHKLYQLRIGQTIRKEECPVLYKLHEKKQNTPTMGGALILSAMVISMILWMNLSNIFTIILLLTTLSLGFLGGIDDYFKLKYRNSKGIPPRAKFLIQGLLSLLIAVYFLSPPVSQWLQDHAGIEIPVIKENGFVQESARILFG